MARPHEPREASAEADMSDRQQWLVVAVLAVSALVVPAVIYVGTGRGPGPGLAALGLPWTDTLVALPMIPAVLLGLVGVWSAVRR